MSCECDKCCYQCNLCICMSVDLLNCNIQFQTVNFNKL
uniref:Uncharacterized protein n=1 Tax=Arundo donax TaxID=35708 RepID=A0A0A9BGS4_ARUDO